MTQSITQPMQTISALDPRVPLVPHRSKCRRDLVERSRAAAEACGVRLQAARTAAHKALSTAPPPPGWDNVLRAAEPVLHECRSTIAAPRVAVAAVSACWQRLSDSFNSIQVRRLATLLCHRPYPRPGLSACRLPRTRWCPHREHARRPPHFCAPVALFVSGERGAASGRGSHR